MTQHTHNSMIDAERIGRLLKLEGIDLLESAVLILHQMFGTQYTTIIEKKYFPDQMVPLVIAHSDHVLHDKINARHGHIYQQAVHQQHPDCSFAQYIIQSLPTSAFKQEITSQNSIAIPTRTQSGEVMGVLFSTFTSPLNPNQLQNVIKHHQLFANIVIHTLREIWFNERSEQLVNQLSYEVSHDSLTGLLNRSCLSDTLESITQQRSTPFTLALLDVNSFKAINDMHGNYIGDKVLQYVAETLRRTIPENNLTFRTAGNEFAFITYHSDPIFICEQILAKIKKGYNSVDMKVAFDISIGIARSEGSNKDVEQIIFNTSLALKECKQRQDTHIQCYDTHLISRYQRKMELVAALRNELESATSPSFTPNGNDNEMYVVVQPIVGQSEKQWEYFEVLTRWKTAKHGNVSPMEFIKVAEESGLIVELGEHIIDLVCRAKTTLEKGLGYKIKLGINCSAHELSDSKRYISYLTRTIERHNFKANEFVIELTETVLLSPTKETKSALNYLREQGFSIALDDFGTGYSSLNYIHSYPIDCIKIDATFIRNLLTNSTSESVVWLIIQLAHRLDLSLVAEGVEKREQLEKLHAMGCDKIQGYLYSPPMRPEAIISYVIHSESLMT
ncbi:EAL domain-containing protein [Vibrio kanaloae]|uniref:putative bifunctional diguanylate cyclase/phosphodiesterase n=1 Tax=Vibrio kanaloae TaxID=170673 RepID=UPI0010BD7383|nr:GGDEF domain-containing phosphodiesterase [Vibrio kanaloae]NOI01592.1 EAL domain-containing protein [Vibrio kanaloae]TKF04584.1 EAL domain-containing protein [Vibrio kanaloae]TKF57975.1 EAL domain-containing protein [Vibrio kanaloae]